MTFTAKCYSDKLFDGIGFLGDTEASVWIELLFGIGGFRRVFDAGQTAR